MPLFTCSMTRANKLLGQLRSSSDISTKKHRHYTYGVPAGNYSAHTTSLSFDRQIVENEISLIKKEFNEKLVRTRLLERLKNKLFTLNITYGINDILSQISILQKEESLLAEILTSYKNEVHYDLDKVERLVSYQPDKPSDMKWSVIAFDVGMLTDRRKSIKREILKLDEKKDMLNIQNSFSIELSPEEKELLNLTEE